MRVTNLRVTNLTVVAAGGIVALAAGNAWGAACTAETLNNYLVAGFTCTEGDKTFSGFTYLADGNTTNGASTPAPTAIEVVPETGPPGAAGFTFLTGCGLPPAPVPLRTLR